MTSIFSVYLVILFKFSFFYLESKAESVEVKIKNNADLSEFYRLVELNYVANASLEYRSVTVFAPVNKAFQYYEFSVPKETLASYHMATVPTSLQEFISGRWLASDYEGNPPLWMTFNHRNEYYINNAKIIISKSNNFAMNQHKKSQVMHIITDILEPLVSTDSSRPIYNPDAFDLLNHSQILNIGRHKVTKYFEKVIALQGESLYKAEGRYTFFFPVDDGLERRYKRESHAIPPHLGGSIFYNVSAKSFAEVFKRSTIDMIDHKVLDGHIIPRFVLFTNPAPQGLQYKTLAFQDNLKVSVSITRQSYGKYQKLYAKCQTVVGDGAHPEGITFAEIVRPNIPVKNGVVHLITNPLVVVDKTLETFLTGKRYGPLNTLYDMILQSGGRLLQAVTKSKSGVTLLAPSNDAWNQDHIKAAVKDKNRLRRILELHLIMNKLTLDDIEIRRDKEAFQVMTAGNEEFVYFDVFRGKREFPLLTLEGGGVNSTVTQADLMTKDGVIHVINHVLGVPYLNVREKMATDPMLRKTFLLGERSNFNDQLSNMLRNFTIFVPKNDAWEKAEILAPTAYKKLLMPQYNYHAKHILERHLIIHDQILTMNGLMNLNKTNSSFRLPTLRDNLEVKISLVDKGNGGLDADSRTPVPSKEYVLEWRGETIRVVRPNVNCTNGIIHVIDRVFLKEDDVRVPAKSSILSFSLVMHLGLILLAKLYLN